MGVEPFLVTASVILIMAQRLVRTICPDCKEEVNVPEHVLLDIGVKPQDIGSFTCYRGTGCRTCSDTGYKGRLALFEVMPLTDNLCEFILNGASAAELKAEAIREGMKTLRQAGITKLKEGVTTIEEVTRVTAPD
jgi:type IV pilus assembly protein PilB